MSDPIGYEEGETCGRLVDDEPCDGILETRPVENCSCHISAPCHNCTADRTFCPVCDYDARYEDD